MLKPPQKLIDNGRWWEFGWTLVEGCTPVSEGCEHCWSAAMAHRFDQGLTIEEGAFSGKVIFCEDRLDIPLRRREPTVYAVWNDLFHEAVTTVQLRKTFNRIERAHIGWVADPGEHVGQPYHCFLILTKRPERMTQFVPYYVGATPRNVWLGVTVENQREADRRLPYMKCLTPYNRFLSVEPLLEPVTLKLENVDWVIVGGESGPKARPCDPEWIWGIVNQCRGAGIPCFVKQLGTAWARTTAERWRDEPDDNPHSWQRIAGNKGQWALAWPEYLQVREWPDDRC